MSLPLKVLVGGILGIISGILLGQYAKVLNPIGTVYIMMLEMAAYPYIISTLIVSIGRLKPQLWRRLFKKSWPVYFIIISIGMATLLILQTAIPTNIQELRSASDTPTPNLLELIIPENLFHAL